MGGDGHTASIFPGPDLEEAMAPAKGVKAIGVRPDPLPPEAPVDRITLTTPAIAAARTTMMVISGAEKQQLLEKAIEDGVNFRSAHGSHLQPGIDCLANPLTKKRIYGQYINQISICEVVRPPC